MSFNVSKALKHRLILIGGAEEYLVRRALAELIQEAGLQKDDFDLETMGGDSSSPSSWLASAGTAPFLADRRAVVVRNVLRAKTEDLSLESLKVLPESALLILVLDDEPTDDRKTTGTGKKKSLEKLVTQAGGYVAFFEPDPKKSREAVKAEVALRGKSITPVALDTLVEMTGGSLSRASEELDKVVLFTRNDQISEYDVRSVVVASREWNVWKMIDAMTQGDVPESLRQMKTVVSGKAKVEDIAFGQLFPLIMRQLRFLYQGRVCVEAGCSPSDAPERVRQSFPAKPNLGAESSYRQGSIMRAAKGLSLGQISAAMGHLSEADARLKGLEPSFSGMDTMERLVFDLASTLNPKSGLK